MPAKLSQHYTISEAVISAERFNVFGNKPIEVSQLIAELEISESAVRPYTTGKVALVDQSGFLRKLSLVGSERLTITFTPAIDSGKDPIIRKYVMIAMEAAVNNETFVFELVEEFGYKATTKKINRAYTDSLDNMLEKIAIGELGQDLYYLYEEDWIQAVSNSQRTHIVVPNFTAWETMGWIVDRMSTQTGTPWFMCGSLYNEDINVWSLEKALDSVPFNINYPYLRSDTHAYSTTAEHEGTPWAYTNIASYQETNTDSMHTLDRKNSLSGIYDYIDTSTNTVEPFQYSLADTLLKLEGKNLIKTQDVIDGDFAINDKFMSETPSCTIAQATSNGTYLLGNSYSDDPTDADKVNKLSNRMMKNVMMTKSIVATMPGNLFAMYQAGVGRKVRMLFDTSDRGNDDTKSPEFDPKLSGDYVITGITHQFQTTDYKVTIEATKFNRNPKELSIG